MLELAVIGRIAASGPCCISFVEIFRPSAVHSAHISDNWFLFERGLCLRTSMEVIINYGIILDVLCKVTATSLH